MSPAEIAARQALLEQIERFAAKLRAELSAEGAPMPAITTEALRIKHVVADYGVSEKTARRWAQKWGKQIGGRWFVTRDAIERRRP